MSRSAAAVSPPTANLPARSRNVAPVDVAVDVQMKHVQQFLWKVGGFFSFHRNLSFSGKAQRLPLLGCRSYAWFGCVDIPWIFRQAISGKRLDTPAPPSVVSVRRPGSTSRIQSPPPEPNRFGVAGRVHGRRTTQNSLRPQNRSSFFDGMSGLSRAICIATKTRIRRKPSRAALGSRA